MWLVQKYAYYLFGLPVGSKGLSGPARGNLGNLGQLYIPKVCLMRHKLRCGHSYLVSEARLQKDCIRGWLVCAAWLGLLGEMLPSLGPEVLDTYGICAGSNLTLLSSPS